MSRRLGIFAITAALATGLVALPAQAAETAGKPAAVPVTKAKATSKSKSKQEKTPRPVSVAAPAAALLPYQLPAQPPKVTFQNGQLAIEADNATMAAVMEQVRLATGATVEATPSFGRERVSASLGPGAPREVVADLLEGSIYNYVLLGSLTNPHSLERVIVTQRGDAVPNTTAAPAAGRPFPVRAQQPPQLPPDQETEVEPEAEEAPEVQQEVPAETQPASPQTSPQPGAAPGTPGQPPQVKTPQELLQELQERMRRQQDERNEQQRQQQEEEPQ